MPKTRLAAAVIMTRGPEAERQVFLVQRSPELRFMGGYWAFPGGTLIPEDHPPGTGEQESALRRCAMRELFEETGILPAGIGDQPDDRERQRIRDELIQSASVAAWQALLETASPRVYKELAAVCTLITPPFAPVVYRTNFYHLDIDNRTAPTIMPGELVNSGFFKPGQILEQWQKGEIDIAPPVLFLLTLLAGSDIPDFVATAGQQADRFREGALLPVHFVPGLFVAPLATPTLPPATTTNTVIVGHEKLYLVEPATPYPEEQQRLFAWMDEQVAAGKKFEAILLTHHHPDHVGAVNAASQRYRLPVRAHPLTYQRITAGYIKGEPLQDGDRIELGRSPDGQSGWHLQVIHTPGHAADHLCYLDSRYQAAIIGDMLSTISTIVIDPPEGHMRTYLNSLERLHEYPIKTVFPAHGPVHRDGRGLLRKFLQHRREREDKIINALGPVPQTLEQLLPRVYDDVAESSYAVATRSLLAGLIKLEEDGTCSPSGNGWRLTAG